MFFRRKKADSRVKIVNVQYGILGNPDRRKITKTIEKWLSEGYELNKQSEIEGGFGTRPHTMLTFIRPDDE